MRTWVLATALAGSLVLATGCTVRHSRMIDNAAQSTARRVSTSSSGFEIFNIQISDTDSVDSMLSQIGGSCNALKNVEVDYRTMVVLIIGIPQLTVSADCEQ